MTTPDTTSRSNPASAGERGWRKLILALVAFVILPTYPQLRAFLPIDQTIYLLVPCLAACFLVGWWAGGRAILAIAWVALATWMMWQRGGAPDSFHNLERGWSLLLAGSFGLACLFGERRPLFARALAALSIALFLAVAMSAMGPVPLSEAKQTIATEFVHRNGEAMARINDAIAHYPKEWNDLTTRFPQLAQIPAQIDQDLKVWSRLGLTLFPSLLALESLFALALSWAIYHRLSRARLGAPLRPLREFRFNDQLVWGLIAGLTIAFLPTLESLHGVGRNVLVFFYALYALRGFGVLAWFLAPGAILATLTVSFAVLSFPALPPTVGITIYKVLLLAIFALGLGDTWADWRRRRVSSTSS